MPKKLVVSSLPDTLMRNCPLCGGKNTVPLIYVPPNMARQEDERHVTGYCKKCHLSMHKVQMFLDYLKHNTVIEMANNAQTHRVETTISFDIENDELFELLESLKGVGDG